MLAQLAEARQLAAAEADKVDKSTANEFIVEEIISVDKPFGAEECFMILRTVK